MITNHLANFVLCGSSAGCAFLGVARVDKLLFNLIASDVASTVLIASVTADLKSSIFFIEVCGHLTQGGFSLLFWLLLYVEHEDSYSNKECDFLISSNFWIDPNNKNGLKFVFNVQSLSCWKCLHIESRGH